MSAIDYFKRIKPDIPDIKWGLEYGKEELLALNNAALNTYTDVVYG